MLSTDKQTDQQTDKQTDKLTNATKNITSFAKEVINWWILINSYKTTKLYNLKLKMISIWWAVLSLSNVKYMHKHIQL